MCQLLQLLSLKFIKYIAYLLFLLFVYILFDCSISSKLLWTFSYESFSFVRFLDSNKNVRQWRAVRNRSCPE